MTALLAGVDLSTKELTAAFIPLDTDHGDPTCPPVQFRAEPLGKTNHLGTRYRDIHHATRALLTLSIRGDVVLAYVEEPRGPFATRQLNGVFGAVLASLPSSVQPEYIDPQAWRRELGLPRNLKKPDAISEAGAWLQHRDRNWPTTTPPVMLIDEHKADALLVALAGRQINDRHFRSAA